MTEENKITNALVEIETEYRSARNKFPAFHSAHEGYAVLLEEVDELVEAVNRLWDEVKKQYSPERQAGMKREAIQVGAMALAIILENCLEAPTSDS